MPYDASKPADDQWIAQGPEDIRENFEGLRTGRIVDAGLLMGYEPGNADGNIPISNGTKCANLNADLLDGLDSTAFSLAEHVHNVASISSNGFMSSADKIKLNGIEVGAQVNKNSFNRITIGSETIQADSQEDELILVAGTGITLVPSVANDTLTISAHSNANDPTAQQKEALAGTSGTPNNTNRYVTNNDPRMTNARTPVAHKSSHGSGGNDPITPLEIGAADINHTHTPSELGTLSIEGGNITGDLSVSGELTINDVANFNNGVTNFTGYDANGKHIRIGPSGRTLVDRIPANDDSDRYAVEIQEADSSYTEMFTVNRNGLYVRGKRLVIPFILDDSISSTTSKSFTTVKKYRWYKNSANGMDPKYLIFNIGGYRSGSGDNCKWRAFAGTIYTPATPISNTYETIETKVIDISSLPNGIITIGLQLQVGTGTAYSKYFECDIIY